MTTIRITGEISSAGRPAGGVNAADVRRALLGCDGPVTVAVSSPGGLMGEAMRIYQIIGQHPHPVHTHCSTSANSAALVIFLAGERRTCTPWASFCLHHLRWFRADNNDRDGFDAADFRALADELERADASLVRLLAARTGRPESVWQDCLADAKAYGDCLIGAQTALAMGIVHQVTE